MLYQSTPSNLKALIRSIGVLKLDHILKFFRNKDDKIRLNFYIQYLIENNFVDYYKPEKLIFSKDLARVGEDGTAYSNLYNLDHDVVDGLVRTFWAISSAFDSDYIKEIFALGGYPAILICLTKSEIYDLCYLRNSQDISYYNLKHKIYEIENADVDDDMYHIAVIDPESLEDDTFRKKLYDSFFDAFCVYDEKNSALFQEMEALIDGM